MKNAITASVHILDALYHIDKSYDYIVPEGLCDKIRAGAFVNVQFGNVKKLKKALVVSVNKVEDYSGKLKEISEFADEDLWLSHEQLKLCLYMKEHTFCTIGDAVHSIIPAKVSTVSSKFLSLSPSADEVFDGSVKLRSKHHLDILNIIKEEGSVNIDKIVNYYKYSKSQIKLLIDKGYIIQKDVTEYRNPYAFEKADKIPENVLNEEQNNALLKLRELYSCDEAKAALLHGVTGSGKTRVIIAITNEVIASGKQVIILIPEISLTPQTLKLFSSFYGDDIAVIHSSLSQGERFDAYRRIKDGKAKVCIGTRSAVFAPFKNLGMIVIDEEQEHTYKSDSNPKYNTIDIARFRCAYSKSLMLLSSATPSLGSYYKAVSGKYTLIELNQRYGDAKLPETTIYDMRDETAIGNVGPFGALLKKRLKETLEQNKQAVIFLNRRGYNHFASCPNCGEVILCPHCSVSLTKHTSRGVDELKCHYCGYTVRTPDKCPKCGGEHLQFIGYGTQKVEEELGELCKGYKVLRMDADSTSTKFAYENMLNAFRNHEGDILLGTQMVTKGHDFPDVVLSGILLADMSLYLDDYRANERTFSLITQVIGRAGRASNPGQAVIQTLNPDHPVLKMAAKQDYKTFYQNEIAIRKSVLFPPFCDLFLIGFSGRMEGLVYKASIDFTDRLKEECQNAEDVQMTVFGPMEAPIYKVNENYRMRLIIKGKSNIPTRKLFSKLMCEFNKSNSGKVHISIDVNPNSL